MAGVLFARICSTYEKQNAREGIKTLKFLRYQSFCKTYEKQNAREGIKTVEVLW